MATPTAGSAHDLCRCLAGYVPGFAGPDHSRYGHAADLAGFRHYTWVTSAYVMASAVAIPITGRLTDMYGRKSFYLAGLGIFILSSFACGFSRTMTQQAILRGIQGVGAGIIMSNSFTVIDDLFSPAKRGKYQGITSGVFGLSSIVLVAGLLSPFGPCGKIVRMVSSGELTLSLDARILTEYEEVLGRPKFKLEKDKVAALFDHIKHCGLTVASSPLSQSLPGPDEEPFLEVAIAAQVVCLVTGNQIHFPPELCQGVKVFSPSEFLTFFRKQVS